MQYKLLSIIIPVFNEEHYIRKTIEAVVGADSCGLKKEIIIVDDGSNDRTVANIKYQISQLRQKASMGEANIKTTYQKLKIPESKFILVQNRINEGKSASLKKGFLKSTGDIVLVQDADLEYDPADYPRLLEPILKKDADVVYGSRFISDRPHRVLYFWHYMVNFFVTVLSNMLTNLNLTDIETGFKVFNGDLIRKLAPKLESKKFGFEPEITARIAKIPKIKIYEVGISYSGRTYQEGKKIGWVDGVKAIYEIVKFNLFSK